jgi:hypothetical protein
MISLWQLSPDYANCVKLKASACENSHDRSTNKALGVTVEVLLGEPHAKRVISPGGKMRQLFDVASTLPRQKQKAVVEILEGYLKTATTGHAKAA